MKISSSNNKKGVRNVITVENGVKVNQYEESGLNGTLISVQNLFYNVPARRKFLKSESVELRHIIEEFIRLLEIQIRINKVILSSQTSSAA